MTGGAVCEAVAGEALASDDIADDGNELAAGGAALAMMVDDTGVCDATGATTTRAGGREGAEHAAATSKSAAKA